MITTNLYHNHGCEGCITLASERLESYTCGKKLLRTSFRTIIVFYVQTSEGRWHASLRILGSRELTRDSIHPGI